MEDMSQKISQLLKDPETMQQIMSLAGSMGLSDNSSNSTLPTAAAAAAPQPPSPPLSSAISGESMETIMKLLPLLNDIREEDDTTRLLHALRPFLGENRRQKLDEAAKMLQLLRLLPVIKDFNLLSG